MIHIGPVEALWLGINSLTFLLTMAALVDAWHDLRVAADGRPTRVFTARGNVRREIIRALVQVILLVIAIPAIFDDREVALTPGVLLFMALPVLLFVSSALDAVDRSRLSSMFLTDIADERAATALESSLQENIEPTKEVGAKADAAYNEANHVNLKLVELTKLIAGKEDKE